MTRDERFEACFLKYKNLVMRFVIDATGDYQAAQEICQQVFVRYFESEIEVLEEAGEFLRVRHQRTHRLLEIPRSALRMIDGKPHCFNSTSCWLSLRQGQEVAVIQTFADRSFCKRNGQLGWVANAVLDIR